MRKKKIGKLGEKIALNYLLGRGYKFIEKNFRSRFGEIDLICQKEQKLIFVEVKTRSSDIFGLPQEAINKTKIEAIIKTGFYFKQLHPEMPNSFRIDVIAINLDFKKRKILSIEHFKNITI